MTWRLPAFAVLGVCALIFLFAVGASDEQSQAVASCGAPAAAATPVVTAANGQFSQPQLEQLWVNAARTMHIASAEQVKTVAGAVAMAESHGDPTATGIPTPWGRARGLWQILGQVLPGDIEDPTVNAMNAVKKWHDAGNSFVPWTTFTGADTGPGGSPGPKRYLDYMPGGIGVVQSHDTVPDVTCGDDPSIGTVDLPLGSGDWLAQVPGTSATADRRIVADITSLMRRYRMVPGDCYATSGHEPNGEHPLGLACDFVPDFAHDGTWDDVDRCAAWAEPVQNQPISLFRWVGYNGDVNHGRGNHLHLSWAHSGSNGPPAERVTAMSGASG